MRSPIALANNALLAASLTALIAGCGDERDARDFRDCSDTSTEAALALPALLSETPLYEAGDTSQASASAIAFEPRFPLWTDGASKRRWLILPAGSTVDTSNLEAWTYPLGTRFFKEFTRDGVRVETRMNVKNASGWTGAAYVWSADQSDASRVELAVPDVGGTPHDVPSAAECLACHGGRETFVLGFSATQLSAQRRDELATAGILSHPVAGDLDLGTPGMAGLGYLHGNCSHCHNPQRDQSTFRTECYDPRESFDFTLPHDLSALPDAPALRTASEQLGSPQDSTVLKRMSERNDSQSRPSMPPLGTERVDDEGVRAVRELAELN